MGLGLDATAAHHMLHNQLGRGIGSRVIFHGLGYSPVGWAEYAGSSGRRGRGPSGARY
jgi:hypothetical protein